MRLRSVALLIGLGLLISPLSAKKDRDNDDSRSYKQDRNYDRDRDRDGNYDRDGDRDRDRDGKYDRDRDGDRKHKRDKKQKHKPLNRGMQKKLDRGGELPPGWQKKLIRGDTLDREVYRQGRVVKGLNRRGEITIEVDNRLIRLHQATMEIIDVFNSTKKRD